MTLRVCCRTQERRREHDREAARLGNPRIVRPIALRCAGRRGRLLCGAPGLSGGASGVAPRVFARQREIAHATIIMKRWIRASRPARPFTVACRRFLQPSQ